MHYHIQWTPKQGVIAHRSGKITLQKEAKEVRDSFLRNDIAVWANIDICHDEDCLDFTYAEIDTILHSTKITLEWEAKKQRWEVRMRDSQKWFTRLNAALKYIEAHGWVIPYEK